MADVVRLTVQQACDILGVELPDEYKHIADETLTNITSVVNSLSSGGAYILYGKDLADRKLKLDRALEVNPKIVFAGKSSKKLPRLSEVPHVFIKDGYNAVVSLSAAIRNKLGMKVVGVTGSLGKTSTKDLIHSVLSQGCVAGKNVRNRNNTTGIFLSMQGVTKDTKLYVQEFGVAIGQRSMESKIAACVPNAAVITNISDPHVEILGSRENILREKIKLVTEMEAGSPAFLNYDDELLKNVTLENHPIISYALKNKHADYYAEDIEVFDGYIEFTIVHGDRRTPVTLNSVGIHNVENAVVAMAVGEWAGISLENIVRGIAEFKTEGIRQSLSNIGGYKLYIDSYNAAPVSMIGAVHTIARMPIPDGGKRIAVVAEMLELGERSPMLHTQVGEEIGRSNMDLVICYGGPNAAKIAEAARKADKAVLYTNNRNELNFWLSSLITRKDIVVFKGSHGLLLHKSIDQVFGTSFHLGDEYHQATKGSYRYKIVPEADETKRMVAISRYSGKDASVKVPASYDGVNIYCIGPESFKNNCNIEEVILPESILNIAASAFSDCEKLRKINLPSGIKMIEANAFSGCTSLEKLIIPEGVIEIGENAFANCTNLKHVELPASIGKIGDNAFAGCPNAVFFCISDSYAKEYVYQQNT